MTKKDDFWKEEYYEECRAKSQLLKLLNGKKVKIKPTGKTGFIVDCFPDGITVSVGDDYYRYISEDLELL